MNRDSGLCIRVNRRNIVAKSPWLSVNGGKLALGQTTLASCHEESRRPVVHAENAVRYARMELTNPHNDNNVVILRILPVGNMLAPPLHLHNCLQVRESAR